MRQRTLTESAGLVAVAYAPHLLSAPGRVSADSRLDLLVDPGAALARATDLWDPQVGAGTVPHQGLGYLVPTAPWFWLLDRLGCPDWLAQRLWWGTLTLVALLGARWLLARTGTGRTGAVVGALVYGLSPYQLAFTARMSVLLLPWAVLPWLVGLTMRATREGGWRAPAIAALVLVGAGGVNASSLLLVGLAPLIWVLLELVRRRGAPAVLAAAGRLLVLAAGVCTWWAVGLWLQGRYGLPVLQLTENARTVAEWSSPPEVLRGLGNWFFYGRDEVGWSLDQAQAYAEDRVVIAAGLLLTGIAVGGGLLVRWGHRAYYGLLVVAGTVVAVGAWPVGDGSLWARAWLRLSDTTSIGLALRNTPRAVPVVLLGLAGLLGGAIGALPRTRWRPVVLGAVGLLLAGTLLPVARHGTLTEGMLRDESLPAHWVDAAVALEAQGPETRILEIPGSAFAAYRWGTTITPLTPALVDRPFLAREVLPEGTPATANLLDAFDRRLQLRIAEPAALPAVARLLGVGTVVVRGDLEQSGRFDTPPIETVWDLLDPLPDGLDAGESFGDDEGSAPGQPAVGLYDVADPQPIVRTASADGGVVLAGDGDGIVDAAAAGLLDGRQVVRYSAALDDAALAAALDAGADLVVTDSNRRRIQTWFYALGDTKGPTEQAGEVAEEPSGYDFRLDLFPDRGDEARTVAVHRGGTVHGTGGRGAGAPEDRAARAVDGDPTTSWRVSGPGVVGQRLTVRYDAPVAAEAVEIAVTEAAPGARAITALRVALDGAAPVEVPVEPGHPEVAVPVPGGSVQELVVEIAAVSEGAPAPVGLREVTAGAGRILEVVRLPEDLLGRVGPSVDPALDLVMSRLRTGVPGRLDEEARLVRAVTLPAARSFGVTVLARPRSGPLDAAGEGCRTDLLEVGGQPVALRAVGERDGAVLLEACAPVSADAGELLVEARSGRDSGLDVDRVVLSSAPGGGPANLAARGGGGAGPALEVTSRGDQHVSATVEAGGAPFWFVLGESRSEGWVIAVDGGTAGPGQLVDGFANGWMITPDGDGPVRITARWTPQRWVSWGLAVSAVTVVLALVMVARTRGRQAADLADTPRLAWGEPAALDRRAAALLPVAVVAVVGAVVAPLDLLVLAVPASLLAALGWWGRLASAVVAGAALLGAEALDRPTLAWLAVLVLLAAVARDVVVARGARRALSG